ncbi:MAG: tyrosine-type recombinase/integrase [Betaproteobacteria bacterium]|nr:tyrosine-type recombinase/integrase [Betaproteobacteria bacterium]
MNIAQAVDDYLRHLQAEGRSPHTVSAYRRDLAAFESFADGTSIADLGSVTPADLVAFMASPTVHQDRAGRTRAPASINRYRVTVKALYAFAEARWLVERNPTAILRCQRHRGLPPVVLDAGEIARLVAAEFAGGAGRRDHALICFMLLTGCRLAETAALNVGDIDLDARVAILRKTKGGDPDRVMLSPTLAGIVAGHIGGARPGAPLFATGGRRLSTRQVQRIVTRRVQEAGITKPITAHSLRHSFATRLYNATGDIRLVQQALRHTHVSTTEVYAQVDPQRWRASVAAIA